MNLTDKTGLLAGQMLVHEEEDVLLITDDGTIIRTPVSSITTLGRNTQGVRLMKVEEGAQVVCVARAEAEEEDSEEEASGYLENGGEPTSEIEAAARDMSAPLQNNTGRPDALDRLVQSLEENPEPEDDV